MRDAHWDGDISVFRELEEQLLDSSIRRSPKIVADLLADVLSNLGVLVPFTTNER